MKTFSNCSEPQNSEQFLQNRTSVSASPPLAGLVSILQIFFASEGHHVGVFSSILLDRLHLEHSSATEMYRFFLNHFYPEKRSFVLDYYMTAVCLLSSVSVFSSLKH